MLSVGALEAMEMGQLHPGEAVRPGWGPWERE